MGSINIYPLLILFILLIWIFNDYKNNDIFVVKAIFITGIIELGFSCVIYENFGRDFQLYELLEFTTFLILLASGYRKKIPYSYLLLLLTVIISNICLIFYPPKLLLPPFGIVFDILLRDKSLLDLPEISMRNLFLFLRILMIYPFLIVYRDLNGKQYNFISSLINVYGLTYLGILFMEFTLKNLGLDLLYENYFTVISGQDASLLPGHLVARGGLKVLHGLVAEPSHLAYALVIPLFFWANKKDCSFKLLAALFFLVASGSYRCLILAAFGTIIYFSNLDWKNLNPNKVLISTFTFFIIMAFVILDETFSYYTDSLMSMLSGNFNAGSQSVRFNTYYYGIDAFFVRPLFGVGLGNINIPSGFFGIIGSLGIIGLLSYLLILKNCLFVNFFAINTIFLLSVLFFSFDTKLVYSIGVYTIFLSLNKNIFYNRN